MQHGDLEMELTAIVHYSYRPGAPAITSGSADNWDPGYGPELEDVRVMLGTNNITDAIDSVTLERIHREILDNISEND